MEFRIATDGDDFEKRWWPQWTSQAFPSYEAFWLARIVPLTYRVKHRPDVRLQTKAELDATGYTDEDVAVAQLHYTLLRHLGRVFESPTTPTGSRPATTSRIVGSGKTSSSRPSPDSAAPATSQTSYSPDAPRPGSTTPERAARFVGA